MEAVVVHRYDRTVAKGEDIGGAVVQSVMADQMDDHADEAVVAVKANGPWSVVFVPSHCPQGK